MKSSIDETIFYHIYPLGLCNCPRHNDFCQSAGNGIRKLSEELERIRGTGANAVYMGPLLESTAHGYDTVDYFWVDRRLGTNEDFKEFVRHAHSLGMKVILDAVYNHTGRDFFAFRDLQRNGRNSSYADWYMGLDFTRKSSCGDCFTYSNWAGCDDLVKLNLDNPQVQDHLLGASRRWITEFDVDGLRLDAADVISFGFMRNLKSFCTSLKPDFWLMGEVVHGDYNQWVNEGMLDSVTNYQLHKGMWSSFHDRNFFEVAYSLNQMFGDEGKFRGKMLYNFLDNHDVNRVASNITNKDHLIPLYALLFTVPGIPSIYYGSEYGLRGRRNESGDYELRPALPPFAEVPDFASPMTDGTSLSESIRRFAEIRKENLALRKGNYTQISVTNTLFVFMREFFESKTIVAMNCEDFRQEAVFGKAPEGRYRDLVTYEELNLQYGSRIPVSPNSARILAKI